MAEAEDGRVRPLADRLGVRAPMRVALLHAPEGIDLGPLPDGVVVQHGLRRDDRVDLVLGFVIARDHLARNIGWLVRSLPDDGAFWVAWPAGGAEVGTDMSDEAIRAIARPLGWVGDGECAIDAGWIALRLIRSEQVRAHPES